jgi:hypothetical protein
MTAAQQAVEAVGRASSRPAPSCLSPVVKYHGLGHRSVDHLVVSWCGRSLTAVRWAFAELITSVPARNPRRSDRQGRRIAA